METDEFKGWTNADIVCFINAYRACPQLWNQSDPNYHNKPVRIEAWGRIAGKFGLTKVECKKKIFGLISTYRKLKMKAKWANANGEATEPSWFAYPALKFIDSGEGKQETPSQAKSPISERQVSLNMLTLYKKHHCLWDNTHPDYSNRDVKNEKYELLLAEWKKIQPMSNIDTVKRKLINWKTAFRRERNKVEKSKGRKKPTLWYYDYLTFLYDKSAKVGSNPANEGSDADSKSMFEVKADPLAVHESGLSNQEIEEKTVNEIQPPATQQPSEVIDETRGRRRKKSNQNDDTELIASVMQILESTAKRLQNEDEKYEIEMFSKFISTKMWSYSKSTRQGVQHAFYDVLMKADRGHFKRLAVRKPRLNSRRNEQMPQQRLTPAQSAQTVQNIAKPYWYLSSQPEIDPLPSKKEAVEYEYLPYSPSHESTSGSSDS